MAAGTARENQIKGGVTMGLFDKLFDKKECAICGREIGLMGNRKLADEELGMSERTLYRKLPPEYRKK